MGQLSVFEGTGVQRDCAGLFAACVGNTAVQPPQRGQLGVDDRFLDGVRQPSEGQRGLCQVVLQQPSFSQGCTHPELVFAGQRSPAKERCQHLHRFGPATPLERGIRLG